jgi:hypothetical protein
MSLAEEGETIDSLLNPSYPSGIDPCECTTCFETFPLKTLSGNCLKCERLGKMDSKSDMYKEAMVSQRILLASVNVLIRLSAGLASMRNVRSDKVHWHAKP